MILKRGRAPHGERRDRGDRRVLRARRRHRRPRRARPRSATWVPRSAPPPRVPVRRPHGRVPEGDRPRGDRRRWPNAVAPRPARRRRSGADPGAVLRSGRRDRPVGMSAPHQRARHAPTSLARSARWARGPVAQGMPTRISTALVGSCTNSCYEDITRAASIARQAPAPACAPRRSCSSRPAGSRCAPRSNATACWPISKRSGPRCWPTRAGRASASGIERDRTSRELNTIVNILQPQLLEAQRRPRRYEGVRDLARDGGRLRPGRHPRVRSADRPTTRSGRGPARPAGRRGAAGARLHPGVSGFHAPPDDGTSVEVIVRPDSERFQLLVAFPAWDGTDYTDLPVLLKAKGKCTTDQISAAGKWLRLPRPSRAHLGQPLPRA